MKTVQYTIRNVSPQLDAKLRSLAAMRKKSMNSVLLDQLESSVQTTEIHEKGRYSKFAGTWLDDPGFDEAMKDMRVVDPKDWDF